MNESSFIPNSQYHNIPELGEDTRTFFIDLATELSMVDYIINNFSAGFVDQMARYDVVDFFRNISDKKQIESSNLENGQEPDLNYIKCLLENFIKYYSDSVSNRSFPSRKTLDNSKISDTAIKGIADIFSFILSEIIFTWFDKNKSDIEISNKSSRYNFRYTLKHLKSGEIEFQVNENHSTTDRSFIPTFIRGQIFAFFVVSYIEKDRKGEFLIQAG